MEQDVPLVGALVLSTAGVLFSGFGWYVWEDVRAFRRHGVLHEARVTRVEIRHSRKNRTTYRPFFGLPSGTGDLIEHPGIFHSAGHDLPIGSTHRILALPGREAVLMADCRGGRVLPLLLAVLGAGLLGPGVWGLAGHLGAF